MQGTGKQFSGMLGGILWVTALALVSVIFLCPQSAYATTTVSKDFSYTGSIQTFTAPASTTYTFEVWGSEGGATGQHLSSTWPGSAPPGKGGYAKGTIFLSKGQTVYIVVGGTNGYNGGGAGSAAGGGATHIATASGLLSALSSNRGAVKIVAGGGGGSEWGGTNNGDGGGTNGGTPGASLTTGSYAPYTAPGGGT